MNRLIALCLLGAALFQGASAQSWPKVPLQPAPITIDDVKAYWINHLPRPAKPRALARRYKQQMASYSNAVSRGRSQIARLRNGAYDEEATIAALRHNRTFYLQQNDHDRVDQITRELTALLELRAARDRAIAAALPAPSTPAPEAVVEEEDVYIQPEEEQYCPPPPRPPRECPPPEPPPCPETPTTKDPPHCTVPSK